VKAAICREFGAPITIEDLELASPGPGQIAVKTAACAICHSDIAYAQGKWGGTLPAVYGHEAAGTITDVGAGVKGFSKGDRVLVTLIHACGTCPSCAGGQPTSCDHGWDPIPSPISEKGSEVVQGMKTGGFAEHMVIDQSQCIKLPDDIELDVASLLACGVITGVGAVTNSAKLKPGQTAVVIGAGGVGLNTIQGCAIAGASQIIAVDLAEEKLDAAQDFGATHALLASDTLDETVRSLTNGRGVDYVFVTVGAPQVFQSAPDLLAAGGAMIMVGMTGIDDEVTYKPVNLAAMNQSLVGSRMGQTVLSRDIPWLLQLYRDGRLKLDELISNRYKLEEINEAFKDTQKGVSRRNVIVFD